MTVRCTACSNTVTLCDQVRHCQQCQRNGTAAGMHCSLRGDQPIEDHLAMCHNNTQFVPDSPGEQDAPPDPAPVAAEQPAGGVVADPSELTETPAEPAEPEQPDQPDTSVDATETGNPAPDATNT